MTRYRRLGAAALLLVMLLCAGSAAHAIGKTHVQGEVTATATMAAVSVQALTDPIVIKFDRWG